MLNKSRIALICGGSSSEREVSLNSGKQVYAAIDKDKYDVTVYDPVTDIVDLVNNASKIDFAFIILHGSYGEDGTIQGLLDILGIPYQGSGVLGSAIAMNKVVSKRLFQQSKIPTAPYVVIDIDNIIYYDCIEYIESKLGFPIVIKPTQTGSSIGISIVKNKEDFYTAILKASNFGNSILIEAYIEGIEVTCGVLGNTRLEALPLVEIVHNGCNFFDYKSKYSKGSVKEICPARINDELTKKAQSYAKKAHDILFCRGYSRTDMIIKNDNFYLLETNSIPGMTLNSLYPKSAKSIGISFKDLVERLISLGFENSFKK